MKYLVSVKRRDGSVVWENEYANKSEAEHDALVLGKPSVFGVSDFVISIVDRTLVMEK